MPRKLLLLLLLISPGIAIPQAPVYFFKNYTTAEGLSDKIVRSVIRDSDGYLWAGTTSGLNRFNGYQFKIYRSLANDTTTLVSNIINHLIIDRKGQLWVASYGACIYIRDEDRFRRIPLRTAEDKVVFDFEVLYLFEDQTGNILACTNGIGILKYDPNAECFRPVGDEQFTGKILGSVTGMIQEPDGRYWVSTYKGLYRFGKDWSRQGNYPAMIGSDRKPFQMLRVFHDPDEKGHLWFTTWGHGLVLFDTLTKVFKSFTFESGLPVNLSNITQDILFRKDGLMWVASNSGLMIFDPARQKFSGPVTDNSMTPPVTDVVINDLYADQETILWVGTHTGLANINPSKQQFTGLKILPGNNAHFLRNESRHEIYSFKIYDDRSVRILNTLTGDSLQIELPGADLYKAEPFHFTISGDTLVWIGTTKGIYTFDVRNKKVALFDISGQTGIPNRSVYVLDMELDRSSNLWVACYQFLLVLENATGRVIKVERPENGEPFHSISHVVAGDNGSILFLSPESGIFQMDSPSSKPVCKLSFEKSGMRLSATSMEKSASGGWWLTTRNSGLVYLDERFQMKHHVYDSDGSMVTEQMHLAVDKLDRPWFVSNARLYMFNRATESFVSFTEEDGLPRIDAGTQLNKLDNGNLAFNTINGVYEFDPVAIKSKVMRPKVYINFVSVNGKPYNKNVLSGTNNSIVLHHNENNIRIDFAAVNFTNPSSTQYIYMLEGVSDKWSEPTTSRSLNFNQLSPGEYKLRIRAGSPAADSDSPVSILKITIIPAWYQTVWFHALVLIMALAIVILVVRYLLAARFRNQIVKMQHQREIEQMRARISRDIHDEIGSGLTKIKLISRSLGRKTQQDHQLHEQTSKISETSDELIRNLGEIVWTINPGNDSLENIVAYIRMYLSNLFEENPDIQLQANLPDPSGIPSDTLVYPEVKRNLLLIIKESLNNIFRHSEAGKVWFELIVSPEKIRLEITDNGKGIRGDLNQYPGNGLKNMQKRAHAIGADLKIASPETGGTKIELEIPL